MRMADGSRHIEVVGLGQACVDYLGRIPVYPGEDQKVELMDLHRQCGGPASTALVTLSRLGVKTSFLGSISDDLVGIEIVEGLKIEGVDFSSLKITPGFTSQFAFIAINKEDGKRTIFWHRGSVPHLRKEDIYLRPYEDARILHLDGLMIEASMEAAKQARSLGIRVVLDGGTLREGSRDLVSLVDVLIASERFIRPIVGEDAPPERAFDSLKDWGPREIVITMGTGGSVGWNGERDFFQEAFPITATDTTGAGDVYHGGYIYGLLQDFSMPECMRFASAAAAMKCREIGARKGIPGLREIQAFLKTQKNESA
jgi:ribokinase